jgi:hypothetical protein
MQLRISVCDKGGYAVKVAEFEFWGVSWQVLKTNS